MQLFICNKNLPIIKSNNNITFISHFHYEVEILYLIKGEYRVKTRQKIYELKSGDIYFAFPFEPHEYENLGVNESVISIFQPETAAEYRDTLLLKRLLNPVINVSELYTGFGDLLIRLAGLRSSGKSDESVIANYLSAIVGELLSVMPLVTQTESHRYGIEKILRYCQANFDDPSVSLELTAKALCLNRCYISHIMKRHLGIGFVKFINSLRINKACKLLLITDKNITDIAYECGFESQRTFNRVFLNLTGMTPSLMRKDKNKISVY